MALACALSASSVSTLARRGCDGEECVFTSDAICRSHVDLNERFFGQLIAALHFDRSIDGAEELETSPFVAGRAVGVRESTELDFWRGHWCCG